MRLPSSSERVLPNEWTGVLDHIQRVLADALQAADARAAALDAQAADVSSEPPEKFQHLLTPAPDCPLPSEQQAAEIEQALAAAQQALDQWLTEAGQVAQK